MAKVLIIDDDQEVRETMCSLVRRMRHACAEAASLGEGVRLIREGGFDVVFLDVRLPDGNGLSVLSELKSSPGSPEVVILTGQGDPDGAELAISGGAWDYLLKPCSIRQSMLSLSRALKYREEKSRERTPVALVLENVVGQSPKMLAVYDLVAQAARSSLSVLITGETGTGKELFARSIHANSERRERPFVAVDCASLTESLIESTLFGHKKGAFTGAESERTGLVKAADTGTLFLDEVGEMPLSLQKSFLRVLQERKFRPVGSSQEIESDFRLIAATNRDLEPMVEQNQFRRDLLFRLKTINIYLPPLRERLEDVKPLAMHHVNRLCEKYALPYKGFDQDFFCVLREHAWPGNVRELFNVVERAFVASGREKTLYPMHLPQELRIKATRTMLERSRQDNPAPFKLLGEEVQFDRIAPKACAGDAMPGIKEFKENMERVYLENLLRDHGQDLARMLELSGLSRSHFYALLKKYDLS